MLFGTLQVGNPLLRSKEQCCLMHRSQNSASLKPGFLNVLPEYKLTVVDIIVPWRRSLAILRGGINY